MMHSFSIRRCTVAALCLLPLLGQAQQKNQWLISAPAGKQPARIDRTGTTILPNGRFIKPMGRQVTVAPHPYGLVLSPDGNTVVTANSGTSPLSISIIRNIQEAAPAVQQIPPGANSDKGVLASVFMGLAISPSNGGGSANQTVYVAGGQENRVYQFDLATGEPRGFIDCSAKTDSADYTHGYIGDLVLTRDGRTIYAVDQIGFRLVVIDVPSKQVRFSVPVGRYPFGVTLSPDEKRVYVANVGMFAYKPVESLDPNNMAGTALTFPPFGVNSREAREGIKTDSVRVPGLGDPNVPESFSVWTVDVGGATPQVIARTKTGILVGQKLEDIPAVGGASPNSLVATADYVFVSNGNNDCVSVIDARTHAMLNNIFLNPEPRLGNLRGIIPFGLALSPDQKRLYVAEAGINAVGIIDVPTRRVLGHLPVGWFPAKLAVTRDNQLVVSNAKGYGSGPNGGRTFTPGPEGSNIGKLMKGTVSILPIPVDTELARYTQEVITNNFTFQSASASRRTNNPIPNRPGEKASPIKYWVFISKENRTYDEVFGQLATANGDPTIARFGENVSISSRNANTPALSGVSVMPNHLALARQFAVADNFYVDADHSADGHRWLVGTYPNQWVETSTSASYGNNRSMRANSKAPGNLAISGSSSAIYPEDYNEHGSIWDHFDRHRIPYFNFGLGLGLNARLNDRDFKPLGVKYLANFPLPGSLWENSSRMFPVYNTAIPDQFRVDQFIKEAEMRWVKQGKDLPAVMTLRIPNDHGAGERPGDGYPYLHSYMADNDLAIGRVVEYLSRTKYWKNMAIVITEDDSQGGVDHVDAHRSVLLVISPYVKRGYVGSAHYSFGSIFKTFWHTLNTPYLNQYDAGASDLSDLFTDKPDFTPYNAKPVDARLFDPQKALTPLDEKFNWKAVEANSEMDNPAQMIKDSEKLDQELREQKTKKKGKQ
ncbi:hypothetical protein DYU11_10300 [Fibrisoma montanum]|uniref:Phosphoesterase n=1 Tax=Fibrisoma montanum TaxID=2305895 RepID=A0A418MAL3_9BACT|nr:alkaline phosphatase family protein [Fibrisoma montanum]RIV23389.1 hypothetical protein DYU11_10300 [Fibrisoma montanum]